MIFDDGIGDVDGIGSEESNGLIGNVDGIGGEDVICSCCLDEKHGGEVADICRSDHCEQ